MERKLGLVMTISYRNLTRGIITKLNPKKVAIACRSKWGFDSTDTTSQFYDQIIKVPDEKRILKLTSDGKIVSK